MGLFCDDCKGAQENIHLAFYNRDDEVENLCNCVSEVSGWCFLHLNHLEAYCRLLDESSPKTETESATRTDVALC